MLPVLIFTEIFLTATSPFVGVEDLLEHRSNGTDAFDTLYLGCEKFLFHDIFALSVAGVS